MKGLTCLLFLFVLAVVSRPVQAQTQFPYNSFEDWTTDTVLFNIPPYVSSNLFAVLYGAEYNVYPVAAPNNGEAIRLESVTLSNGAILSGILGVGTFGADRGGLRYTEEPDSLYILMRYHLEPGDSAGIFPFFNVISGGPANLYDNGIRLGGDQPNWTLTGFDLPDFIMPPDSIIFYVWSSFNSPQTTPQAGSWIEIDTFFFSNNTPSLPNAGFRFAFPQTYDEPDGWLSHDALLSALETGESTISPDTGINSFSGQRAVRIEVRDFPVGQIIDTMGYLTNAQFFSEQVGTVGGQAVPEGISPSHFSGYYKYYSACIDTGFAYLRLWTSDLSQDTAMGIALPPAEDFRYFEIDAGIDFAPDSFMLFFSASDIYNLFSTPRTTVGSVLWLDSLFFDGVNSIGEKQRFHAFDFSVYPNPSSDFVQLDFEARPGQSYELNIFTFDGRQVAQFEISASEALKPDHTYPVHQLTPGLYQIVLKDEMGQTMASEKLLIK